MIVLPGLSRQRLLEIVREECAEASHMASAILRNRRQKEIAHLTAFAIWKAIEDRTVVGLQADREREKA